MNFSFRQQFTVFSICLGVQSIYCHDFTTARNTISLPRSYLNEYLAVFDFNNDGYEDLLVGQHNTSTLAKTPLSILINQKDGTFQDKTSDFITGDARSASPVCTTADYNGDGTLDFAVFDQGNVEIGQSPEGGFYGEETLLLLSSSRTHWNLSSNLADAYQAAHPEKRRDLHCKYATSADIDNDGDIDILAEAGGGYKTILSHFYINDGSGKFTVSKVGEGRIEQGILDGGPSADNRWRYVVHAFADVNNDGFLDWIMGQLRRPNNKQEMLRSLVMLNDGKGKFPTADSIQLVPPQWNNGYTFTKKILPFHLDNDGYIDIIISHERGDIGSNFGNTGNYFQFLKNNGGSSFTDVTVNHIKVSDEVLATTNTYGNNGNALKTTMLKDINNDNFLDLVIPPGSSHLGPHNPTFYLNNGLNYFTAFDYTKITKGQGWFGEDSFPIDINNDGNIDLISLDLKPGPDGQYGTGDEFGEMFPIYGVRNYPIVNNISLSDCGVKVPGLKVEETPSELGITQFKIDNITGCKIYRSDNGAELLGGALIPKIVAENGFLITAQPNYSGNVFFRIQGATDSGTVGSPFLTRVNIKKNTITGHAGNDITICEGETTSIGIPEKEGFSYSWSPTLGVSETNKSNPKLILNQSGSFTYTVTASKDGCTSTDEVVVKVESRPQKPVISLNEDQLTASVVASGYQWRRNEVILADTTQFIKIQKTGFYEVRLKNESGCWSEWSEKFDAVITSIEPSESGHFRVFPNPSNGAFNIEFDNSFESGNLFLFNSVGTALHSDIIRAGTYHTFHFTGLPQGIYIIQIKTHKRNFIQKIVIAK
jgi:hypothetical protein